MPDSSLRGQVDTDGGRSVPRSSVLHALSNRRRRLVLAVLADRTPPVDERTLSRWVLDRERPQHRLPRPDERATRSVHASLVHVHLPALAKARLVDYDPRGVVTTPAFDALLNLSSVRSLLDESLDLSPETVDRGLHLLANDHRRQVLEELAVHSHVPLEELAAAVAIVPDRPSEVPDEVEQLALELYHVHVPKLVAADVVGRDGSDIRYRGDPFLDEWWFTQ